MSKTQRNPSIYIIYILIAMIAVLGGLGAARQYAPDLYAGFRSGLARLPLVEQARTALPAMPPLLSGETGLAAAARSSTPAADEPEPPHLIDEEEMRGVWIATVYSIDFPKNQRNESRQKQELIEILNTARDAGLNTVFFQVRPHGDAFYPSALFPWSEYLTGTAGNDPGYDPLAFLLDEAEQRGIRVHAWINPYRLTMGTTASPKNTHDFLPEGSPVKNRPDLTMACGDGKLYLNPGEPEAMQLVVDGILEIVENYNIDGIHFDDYFYPSDASFNDAATYEKYGKPTGLSLADWRRDNTTTLIRMCNEAIKAIRPGVEFGISPSGIWQNAASTPLGSDTNGFESHNRIYADSRLWVTEELIDYIVPQIYWAIGTKGSDYDILARWWRQVALGTHVKLYIGHGAYRVGTDGAWLKPTEIGNQITLNRALGAIDGSVFYGYSKIAENALGLRDQLKDFFMDTDLAQPLKIAYPASGSTLATANSYIIGSADPRFPLYLDGKRVDSTVSGYFCVYVPLASGKNEFLFTHLEEELPFTLTSTYTPPPPGGWGGGGTPQLPKVTTLDKPAVYMTKDDLTVVRAEQTADSTRMQPLKKGVKGHVIAESNGYYLMDSGNWTYKPNVEILANETLPVCEASSAVMTPGAKSVELAFRVPYFSSYYVDVTDEAVILTLHQTKGQSLQRNGWDPLFGAITFGQNGPHAVYHMPLQKAGRLYGYHIGYDEKTNTLSFRFNYPLTLPAAPQPAAVGTLAEGEVAPTDSVAAAANVAPAPLPLAGKVIMLDPGHGGRDNGATGPAGARGKLEKDVNLDLALALEKVLKEAGAEVLMTRRTDVYFDLEPRAELIREKKPDLAISLHRNSLGAGSNIGTYFGVWALNSLQQSASLAGYLRDALVSGTTHHDGGMRWQSLAMCRIEECPAVLLELGFISNPADYERMTRKSTINKEAQAILRGLIAYMADS